MTAGHAINLHVTIERGRAEKQQVHRAGFQHLRGCNRLARDATIFGGPCFVQRAGGRLTARTWPERLIAAEPRRFSTMGKKTTTTPNSRSANFGADMRAGQLNRRRPETTRRYAQGTSTRTVEFGTRSPTVPPQLPRLGSESARIDESENDETVPAGRALAQQRCLPVATRENRFVTRP